jgi:hypothetical protein
MANFRMFSVSLETKKTTLIYGDEHTPQLMDILCPYLEKEGRHRRFYGTCIHPLSSNLLFLVQHFKQTKQA